MVVIDNDFLYRLKGDKLILNFLGRDVLAVREDNQIFLSAGNIEIAVLVLVAQIAGHQPAVLGERLGGFFGILVVALHLPYTILELNEVYTGEPAGMSDMRLIVNNDLIGLGYGKFARIYHLVDLAADMELYIPALTAPVVFAVNAVGDALTVSVVQSFEDDALVRAFCQVCTENGLKINSNDMGTEVLDTLEKDAVRLI